MCCRTLEVLAALGCSGDPRLVQRARVRVEQAGRAGAAGRWSTPTMARRGWTWRRKGSPVSGSRSGLCARCAPGLDGSDGSLAESNGRTTMILTHAGVPADSGVGGSWARLSTSWRLISKPCAAARRPSSQRPPPTHKRAGGEIRPRPCSLTEQQARHVYCVFTSAPSEPSGPSSASFSDSCSSCTSSVSPV